MLLAEIGAQMTYSDAESIQFATKQMTPETWTIKKTENLGSSYTFYLLYSIDTYRYL